MYCSLKWNCHHCIHSAALKIIGYVSPHLSGSRSITIWLHVNHLGALQYCCRFMRMLWQLHKDCRKAQNSFNLSRMTSNMRSKASRQWRLWLVWPYLLSWISVRVVRVEFCVLVVVCSSTSSAIAGQFNCRYDLCCSLEKMKTKSGCHFWSDLSSCGLFQEQ